MASILYVEKTGPITTAFDTCLTHVTFLYRILCNVFLNKSNTIIPVYPQIIKSKTQNKDFENWQIMLNTLPSNRILYISHAKS